MLAGALMAAALAVVTRWPAVAASTAGSAADVHQQLPIRGAFYYPWFPEAWQQQGRDPFTNFHPSLGLYDSSNSSVVARHIDDMQYGGLEMAISSWQGQRSATDSRFPSLLRAAGGTSFRWTVYHEQEGSSDPSVERITSDLTYLRDRYGSDPSYLRVGGRFAVFVYGDDADGCPMARRWKRANTVGAYVVLKTFPGYGTCDAQPDAWHQYGPAAAASSQGTDSYEISPGFWKANEPAQRLVRDPARWMQNIKAMVASRAKFQLVTTFNEWGEGTAVESAAEWETRSGHGAYLEALHDELGSSDGTRMKPLLGPRIPKASRVRLSRATVLSLVGAIILGLAWILLHALRSAPSGTDHG